ncbi:MAG: chromate efflux transporter [Bacteroidetes bacterium]|nr:chromate efflux transporter [Bacteroidota bacterium]
MKEKVRYTEFLKDVFLLSVSCFGGPQAHIAHFQRRLVEEKKYITEEELIELNALGQVLPGPTSTQTLTAIAYRLRGPNLAYLTLLIWMLPSVIIMTAAGMLIANFEGKQMSLRFTRFIQPMAVGFIAYGGYIIISKTITRPRTFIIMALAALLSVLIKTPYLFPVILLIAGCVTAFNYKAHPREPKRKVEVYWANLFLWIGVLAFAALLGSLTKSVPELLPIRLFENFYRNGSLVFGGGQVLTPMLYTEFVEFKKYLSSEVFLSGYALVQALPGPVYSFSSFIGSLSMAPFGKSGELVGALAATAGIFLPGTFLIFFMIRVWDRLKSFRAIRASLEGILAANAGLVAAASLILFEPLVIGQPIKTILLNAAIALVTLALNAFTKVPSWLVIAGGLVLGIII